MKNVVFTSNCNLNSADGIKMAFEVVVYKAFLRGVKIIFIKLNFVIFFDFGLGFDEVCLIIDFIADFLEIFDCKNLDSVNILEKLCCGLIADDI